MSQTHENKTLLILEDDPLIVTQLGAQIRQVLPGVNLLSAKTISEAQTFMSQHDVDVYVVDINLPDGCGLDFLSDVKTAFPEALTVVMTAAPMRQTRRKAQELGVTRFLEKPFDLMSFADLIRCLVVPESVAGSNHFHVKLKGASLVEVIEIKCMSQTSAVLEITDPGGLSGVLCFYEGNIIHAQTAAHTGIEAMAEMLSWKAGSVNELDQNPDPGVVSIHVQWQHALLESLRLLDETPA
ncbi:MAG: response regulator [Verrucomicrobiae bacterium]|nr:response regulator [Verrucomicrobiae bacterium]